MKTFVTAAAVLFLSLTTKAQDVVKLFHDDTMVDSITYQNNTSLIVINKVDLVNYMAKLDTVLCNNGYNNKIFRNIQFAHLSPMEVENHFLAAKKYLDDSTHTEYAFNTDKFTLFWTQGEGILLPYIEDMMTELLTDGRLAIVERATKVRVPQYTVFYEYIGGQEYKIFKHQSGKIIFRESSFYLEQMTTTSAR